MSGTSPCSTRIYRWVRGYSHHTVSVFTSLPFFLLLFPFWLFFIPSPFMPQCSSETRGHFMVLLVLTDDWPSKAQWFGIRRSKFFPFLHVLKKRVVVSPAEVKVISGRLRCLHRAQEWGGEGARQEEEGTFGGAESKSPHMFWLPSGKKWNPVFRGNIAIVDNSLSSSRCQDKNLHFDFYTFLLTTGTSSFAWGGGIQGCAIYS